MSNDFIPPTPNIENPITNPGVECTSEEQASRLELCKSCVNFTIDAESHTVCSGTGCNISLMTTYSFKQCPLEKW
jgi:hypothetical protein